MTSALFPILPALDDVLFNFAQSDGFWANLETAFGTSYDVVKATQLRETEKTGFFEKLFRNLFSLRNPFSGNKC
jgi:hypothetical protein